MKRLLVMVLLLCCTATFALAADSAKDLSKKANTLIRKAENKFFSRKVEDADGMLKEANQFLEQLKAVDSGYKSLKTLQGKHDRLRKKVDKKLNANTESAQTAIKKSSGAAGMKALSHGAKSNLKKANREMDFAEKELAKGEKSLSTGDYNLVKSYSYNMGSKLEMADGLLNNVVTSNRADPNHPDVAQAFGRLKEIKAKHVSFKQKTEGQKEQAASAKSAAHENAEGLNNQWLPNIKPYIDYSGEKRLQFPGMQNKEKLEKQNRYYREAKTLLANFEKQTTGAKIPHDLSRAVKDLRHKIEVYENDKNAESRNMVGPVKRTLDEWKKRFEKNKSWKPDSGHYLFVVDPKKIAYQKQQIQGISGAMPDQTVKLSAQLAALEQENSAWQKKKEAYANRPQSFPTAEMKSKKMEKELGGLLKDRGIKYSKLNIVDKDWWVLKGEYRYMKAVFLSKDNKGDFWSSFNFRQMRTLSGYGPTELWEVSKQKIRLP